MRKKKKEESERIVKEAEEAKTEGKVWELVNKERRRRGCINVDIEMVKWKEYFIRLPGGVERRMRRGRKSRREGEEEEEERELGREEVKKILGDLKDGKAMGMDELPNEVWKYGGKEMERWAWEVCKSVWKGEGWPVEWKEGVIIPILKKGKGEAVEEYRGVTLMPSLYKVYAAVLAGRLEEKLKRRY